MFSIQLVVISYENNNVSETNIYAIVKCFLRWNFLKNRQVWVYSNIQGVLNLYGRIFPIEIFQRIGKCKCTGCLELCNRLFFTEVSKNWQMRYSSIQSVSNINMKISRWAINKLRKKSFRNLLVFVLERITKELNKKVPAKKRKIIQKLLVNGKL